MMYSSCIIYIHIYDAPSEDFRRNIFVLSERFGKNMFALSENFRKNNCVSYVLRYPFLFGEFSIGTNCDQSAAS